MIRENAIHTCVADPRSWSIDTRCRLDRPHAQEDPLKSSVLDNVRSYSSSFGEYLPLDFNGERQATGGEKGEVGWFGREQDGCRDHRIGKISLFARQHHPLRLGRKSLIGISTGRECGLRLAIFCRAFPLACRAQYKRCISEPWWRLDEGEPAWACDWHSTVLRISRDRPV